MLPTWVGISDADPAVAGLKGVYSREIAMIGWLVEFPRILKNHFVFEYSPLFLEN